ncbi:probable G-protein coupled receptor Mth-like 5 [Prorops nasuta]|uniref:probable G-protein coupled receptor Mth-like 5 n=1 Tax=Prorops nasuta TaxID=863751 RepID=UPI0034CF5081
MYTKSVLIFVAFVVASVTSSIAPVQPSMTLNISKCCELDELLVNDRCTPLAETNETNPWRPKFVSDDEQINLNTKLDKDPSYQLKIGLPSCKSSEHQWHVYYYPSGPDRLIILRSGKLRHYIEDLSKESEETKDLYGIGPLGLDDEDRTEPIHHDYSFGQYCADKVILTSDKIADYTNKYSVAMYAMVCVPEVQVRWSDTGYLMRHAIDPTFHAISIASYLIVAVVYFVLPQLRDLVGNIITSMTLCLITNQCASIVRIFTQFGSHVSFLVADTIAYVSLLGAFFWLNALGYYVWNTFRSRNVFLRVTDGRKYCYYSTYVWCSTVAIASTAIFAHFVLETNKPVIATQETIGWLGISVLFTSVAITVVVDLCFVLTTANRIKRMSSYGRIHHKMKYSFRMFVFLFAIMSTGWLSLLLSRLKYDALVYCHIVVNLLQSMFILYICVFGQRRVTFLLSKTCNCCNSGDNVEGLDWGEEMTAINAGY